MNIATISLGCPKNQVDADILIKTLLSGGHSIAPTLEEADVVLVNTCGFIEAAKQESIEHILLIAERKTQNSKLKLVVTGCLAQRYIKEIENEIPEIDAVVGLSENENICEIIDKLCLSEKVYEGTGTAALEGERVISTPQNYAYLKLSDGCTNRCSYCAIPLIRGDLRSRELQSVLQEAKWLVSQGAKELILVAQDTTAYGADKGELLLPKLLFELQKIENLKWIRILYAYPDKITSELVQAMAQCSKVVKYIDMPVQHINDDILKKMNRKGDSAVIKAAINRLKTAMPEIAIRSTLIVGFPSESEAQFKQLLDFVKEGHFTHLGAFQYSKEDGTPAASFREQIPASVKKQRYEAVMNAAFENQLKANEKLRGAVVEVVAEEYDLERGCTLCRTAANSPDIDTLCLLYGDNNKKLGDYFKVKITEFDLYDAVASEVLV